MHVAATSDKSLKDAMILFGSKCAKPNARIPGVSIAQPPAGSKSGESGSAIALEDVWRPRPVTSFTSPVILPACGTKSLINVDLPTPE